MIIICIIILVLASYIIATQFSYNVGKNYYSDNNFVLPDLGFNIINDMRNYTSLYKIKETLCLLYIIIFFSLIYSNKKALYEYIITIGLILLLKNILFSCTILPDPSQKCSIFSLSNFTKGSCYDLIISSHSVLLFTSLFVLGFNSIITPIGLILCLLVTILIIYFIFALRQHYTIDIINALVYSFLVFYFTSNAIVPNLL